MFRTASLASVAHSRCALGYVYVCSYVGSLAILVCVSMRHSWSFIHPSIAAVLVAKGIVGEGEERVEWITNLDKVPFALLGTEFLSYP